MFRRVPLSLWFLRTLVVLIALAWCLDTHLYTSNHNYFHHLAHAFNNGSLHLIGAPRSIHDLTIFNGKLYLYWGPIPAVVLSPFVALFGTSWPDSWVTLLLGALISTLCLLLLRRSADLHELSPLRSQLLVAVLAFGSPMLPLALSGGVWATSQLFAVAFLFAGVCAGYGNLTTRTTVASSALIGLACLCRPSMAGASLWILFRVYEDTRDRGGAATIRRIALSCAILATCVGLQLSYNYGRFGDLFESGFTYQNVDRRFRLNAATHGQLSLHYFGTNFFYHYLFYPFPWSKQSWWGGSLFLMTPLYFGAFCTLIRKGALHSSVWPLWVTCALIAMPNLMVNGTGWIQIGPRYTLDYAPFLILLVARGISSWPTWLIVLSSLVSFGHYAYGVSYNYG